MVNSDGFANCPTGKNWPFGGEVNTRPTATIDEQVQVIGEILDCLDPKPTINYRCNLHFHVGVPGLANDLAALKRLVQYVHDNEEETYRLIEPIPEPTREQYPVEEDYKGAVKRFRRRKQSHQSKLTDKQVARMLASETVSEFYLAHFVTDKKGVPQKHLHQRCGINLRALWEGPTGTIEFRHFPGTLDLHKYKNSLSWCAAFLYSALNQPLVTPQAILDNAIFGINEKDFPRFEPYVHWMEMRYKKTCFKNTQAEIEAGIKEELACDIFCRDWHGGK
jgi:hypothetical protein